MELIRAVTLVAFIFFLFLTLFFGGSLLEKEEDEDPEDREAELFLTITFAVCAGISVGMAIGLYL